jgi:hypothetical protein
MATKLSIVPTHLTVGQLFTTNLIFRLPKYQRYYAWTLNEIDDFLKDIESCRLARSRGVSKSHFFGGLVTVLKPVPGSPRQNHEVIDGQQRLATFLMLIVQIKKAMTVLAHSSPKGQYKTFLNKKSNALELQYEAFDDTVNLKVVKISRLELSDPDRDFYAKLLATGSAIPSRKSHELIRDAFARIGDYVKNLLVGFVSLKEKVEVLAGLISVIEEDSTVIHMSTGTRGEAYMLFQVLNDRGLGLTEGELLRAKTLELLDDAGTIQQQESVERDWDVILGTDSERVEEALRWLYASYKGTRPGKTTLFDDCVDLFFPSHTNAQQSSEDCKAITLKVGKIRDEVKKITDLLDGQWPFPLAAPVTKWDSSRLRLLLLELKHTNCMPLLISATLLAPKYFAEIVHMLEKFVFRYKVIMNAHISPATSLYQRQAIAIRADPGKYKINALRKEMLALISSHADDAKFSARLRELEYSNISSNKAIKYFLLTLEHYAASIKQNEKIISGDKSRIFDFSNVTIEHIYPANAAPIDSSLEPHVNDIGNLTVLGQNDNNAAGNKTFAIKRSIFSNSSIWMNREISASTSWTSAAIQKRKEAMCVMALKVFTP